MNKIEFKLEEIKTIKTAEEARDVAITWQQWQSEQDLSIGQLMEYQEFFEALANKFPTLKEEFKENAII